MAAMVVIRCPETDREVQTGIVTDLVRFGRLGSGQAEIDCPHCNQRHVWNKADAYMSLLKPRLVR